MSIPFSGHIVSRHQASSYYSMATSGSRRLRCEQFTSGSLRALSFSKAERVGMAIELQQMLQSPKRRTWRCFLTRDESWLYYTINHDHMWIPDGEELPTRRKRTVPSPKRMLTIFWSPLGFSLVEILPKGIIFDSRCFCFNALSAVVQNRPSGTPEDRRRKMLVHFDNATPPTAKWTIDCLRANRLTHEPHPAFSPDLAPLDLFCSAD
jgi:hypothetical protein